MTKEQIEVIVAFLSSQQLAIAHLSVTIANLAGIEKSDIAESFKKTAEQVNENARNKHILNMVFGQIISVIESSEKINEEKRISEQIEKLIH